MPVGLLICLGAGLVSALLFTSASSGTLLGLLVLFFLSPLPVSIAGLGWGWQAAAVAAVTSALTLAIALSGRAAAFHFLALGLPAVVLSYLCLLNRPSGDPEQHEKLEWYPIGRVLTVAAVWAGVLAAIALLTTATDIDGLRAAIRPSAALFMSVLAENSPPDAPAVGDAEITAITEYIVVIFPTAIAVTWMGMAVLNLWLGGLVVRQSGRLMRSWPDLPLITVPRTLPLFFAISIALTFLSGYPGLIAGGFTSAFMFAFLLVGLAIIHYSTRGMSARGLILGAVYAALVFQPSSPFAGLLIAALGLAEPISPLRRRFPPPGAGST
jgi:Predicted membrane protein (DUF2232)